MACVARHTCWVAPQRADDFAQEYDRHLAPLLRAAGADSGPADARATVGNAFTRLWETDSATDLVAVRTALARAPRWHEALRDLEQMFADDRPVRGTRDLPFESHLQVYESDLGDGTLSSVGPGQRQGNWLRYGSVDGLDCAVVDLHEDEDGRLWLASGYTNPNGLYRFDAGELWHLSVDDGLPHERILGLTADVEGRLWLATDDGVARIDGSHISVYGPADGLSSTRAFCAHSTADGSVWFGTRRGLCRFDGSDWTVRTTEDGLACDRVGGIFEAPGGQLWLAAGRWYKSEPGLTCWEPRADRANQTWTSGEIADLLCLAWDGDGATWGGNGEGVVGRVSGVDFEPLYGCTSGSISSVTIDDNHIWATTTERGLLHFDGTVWSSVSTTDGLVSNMAYAARIDCRGSLWISGYSGVSRHDGARLQSFTTAHGLSNDGVMSVVQDRTGRVWFGTWNGVSWWDGQCLQSLDAVAGWHVWRILEDNDGALWFADSYGEGLLCIDTAGKQRRFTDAEGLPHGSVRSLMQDRSGDLWIGTQFGGIARFDGTAFTVLRDGVPDNHFCSLEDSAGALWFGTSQGLCRLLDGRPHVFTTADGLPNDDIYSLLETDEGLLVGTREGLCRFNSERFHVWGPSVVDSRSVMSLTSDSAGRLWIGTRGGVVITAGEIAQTFDRRDGLVFDDVQCVRHDRDGSAWIATEAGVTHYRPSSSPPRVTITAVVADRRYRPDADLQIPAGRVVAFEFTGHSWTTPTQRLRYQCRLQDAPWSTVDAPRQEYGDLPEGRVTFEVRAVDIDLNVSDVASVTLDVADDVLVASLTHALRDSGPGSDFIGRSAAILGLQTQLQQVAGTDLPILLQGETGTGKGLAARFLHDHRPHAGPFIVVNCGAIPEALFDSELFGHERGAFTGATSRRLGKVELAAGGTLFLDEIGDMPLTTQVKLLRVLQEGTFERVGSARQLTAQVRVVSATNRDLPHMVQAERFRADLFYRLEGLRVTLPALRERGEDIELLSLHFIGRMAQHLGKIPPQLDNAALATLRSYPWPGNVRELEHAIQRAVVLCAGDRLSAHDLGIDGSGPQGPDDEGLSLEQLERRHIHRALRATGWVIKGPRGAAQRLGLSATALRRRIDKYGLRPDTT